MTQFKHFQKVVLTRDLGHLKAGQVGIVDGYNQAFGVVSPHPIWRDSVKELVTRVVHDGQLVHVFDYCKPMETKYESL
jgi:hypothetical protein